MSIVSEKILLGFEVFCETPIFSENAVAHRVQKGDMGRGTKGVKCKLRLAEGGFNLRKFMSNSSQLTERIQQNEACISAPAISTNTDQMKSPLDLSKGDSVIEEDKTYAKSMLGTTEESSGAERKVIWCAMEFCQ